MLRLLRTVFTWLLALALPLQGHAAQAMLFCGPAHERPAAVAAEGHDHAAHGHGAASHDEQAGGSDAQPLDGPSAVEASQGKCSVCAACCSMAAITGDHALPGGTPLSFEYAIAPFEPHAGRTAGGLERPPRSLLV